MLPKNTAVRPKDKTHEYAEYSGFIFNVEGDESTRGDVIPDGWCEVVWDPMDTDGYYSELFRVENLVICGC